MAKGQMRSNKETRKPKQDKPKKGEPAAPLLGTVSKATSDQRKK